MSKPTCTDTDEPIQTAGTLSAVAQCAPCYLVIRKVPTRGFVTRALVCSDCMGAHSDAEFRIRYAPDGIGDCDGCELPLDPSERTRSPRATLRGTIADLFKDVWASKPEPKPERATVLPSLPSLPGFLRLLEGDLDR